MYEMLVMVSDFEIHSAERNLAIANDWKYKVCLYNYLSQEEKVAVLDHYIEYLHQYQRKMKSEKAILNRAKN